MARSPESYEREIRSLRRSHSDECANSYRLAQSLNASRDALAWAETFLARHDAFLQHQTPYNAYSMKDAADGLRDSLATLRQLEAAP